MRLLRERYKIRRAKGQQPNTEQRKHPMAKWKRMYFFRKQSSDRRQDSSISGDQGK